MVDYKPMAHDIWLKNFARDGLDSHIPVSCEKYSKCGLCKDYYQTVSSCNNGGQNARKKSP